MNEEADEPELILEAYMEQTLSEVNALELLKGNIINTKELVSLKMDIIRNRLLYVNTLVRVFSLYIATASLVGSLFGMNLKNDLENEEDVFLQVVWGTIVGCLALLVLLIIFITKSGVAPKPSNYLLTTQGALHPIHTNIKLKYLNSAASNTLYLITIIGVCVK